MYYIAKSDAIYITKNMIKATVFFYVNVLWIECLFCPKIHVV